MAYNYTYKRLMKRKMGVHGQFFFKAFKWIKSEDFENLTKYPKHDKQTSLRTKLGPFSNFLTFFRL